MTDDFVTFAKLGHKLGKRIGESIGNWGQSKMKRQRTQAYGARANRPIVKRKGVDLRRAGVVSRRGGWGNVRTGGYIGIEKKFLDTFFDGKVLGASTDATGAELQPDSGCTGCISMPAQGDGENERDARKYSICSAWVSGQVLTGVNQDDPDVAVGADAYIALVLDTQANGATVSSEDVFDAVTSSLVQFMPQPLRNLENSSRFRILASQHVLAGPRYAAPDGTNTNSNAEQRRPTVNLSWKGKIDVTCKGTTANVSSCSDNALHVIGFSSVGGGSWLFTGQGTS